MGKLGKLLGILIVLLIIITGGLAIFVKFYLTEDRVKAIIVPQVEKNLGRTVALGNVDVGLFKGITINDFAIKEEDGTTNFASMNAFVLKYDLMPLLQKKLVIGEIRLEEPTIQIIRNKSGKFNYESIAAGKAKAPDKDKPSSAEAAALPVGLTVNSIRIIKAKLTVKDALGEIPETNATANMQIGVSLGQDISSLTYNGTMDFTADVVYGEIKPHITGKGKFDQSTVDLTVDTELDKQQVQLIALVKEYNKSPQITVNVTSPSLNIDRLIALASTLPKTEKTKSEMTKASAKGKSASAPAAAIPEGLTARGKIQVKEAILKDIKAQNFMVDYQLTKGIFTASNLSLKSYGGELNSDMEVDLNQPDLSYNGKINLKSIQMTELGPIAKQLSESISGALNSSLSFAGAGTEWEKISKVLTAEGNFSLLDGKIKETPITSGIAGLTGLQELTNLAFSDISGDFKILKGGKISIDTVLTSSDISAETDGFANLDGSLDLPITLKLSPAITEKLKSRTSVAKYLADEKGQTVLRLKLAGDVSSPRPTLDSSMVQEAVKQKAIEKLGEALSGDKEKGSATEGASKLLKGLFNK